MIETWPVAHTEQSPHASGSPDDPRCQVIPTSAPSGDSDSELAEKLIRMAGANE